MADPRRPLHVCTCSVCQLTPDAAPAQYHHQINQMLSCLSEPQRRWYVGSLSRDPAGPSDAQLARITGLSLPTIRRGRREVAAGVPATALPRQRRPGGGRRRAEKKIRA